MSDLTWKKSSYSGATEGNCVEIAALPSGGRAVRDSKDAAGPVLLLTAGQWAALADSVLQHPRELPPSQKMATGAVLLKGSERALRR
jgi:hypothetical protein